MGCQENVWTSVDVEASYTVHFFSWLSFLKYRLMKLESSVMQSSAEWRGVWNDSGFGKSDQRAAFIKSFVWYSIKRAPIEWRQGGRRLLAHHGPPLLPGCVTELVRAPNGTVGQLRNGWDEKLLVDLPGWKIWLVVSMTFYVHPESLGKWSNLTGIFFKWVETINGTITPIWMHNNKWVSGVISPLYVELRAPTYIW